MAPGEALGIIGPNGAGKTTLFGIISGAVAADSGRVLLCGDDITKLAPEIVAGEPLRARFRSRSRSSV